MYKMIIIDDEEKILDGISNLFPWDHIGFEVAASFLSARQALAWLKEHPVDVVMTDISMPDMDGIALVKELQRFPRIRVVLFSSFQDYEYFRSAIRYRVADYLLKPIKYEELIRCFDELRVSLDQTQQEVKELPKSYYETIISSVNQYLKENIQGASLEKAAEVVSLSPSYLSKLYKEKSGMGFLENLNRMRMERAAELLGDPSYKTYEIAWHVGYDNPKNFSRAFRAFYGVTPTEYRNGKRKGDSEA